MVKVGDIVKTKRRVEGGNIDAVAVVTKVNKNTVAFDNFDGISNIEVIFSDGETGKRTETAFIETGRSIDIQSVLDSIR